ncbi:MAG: type VI secretion system baseplate subunit TssK [Holosporales bacterium]|jgi:type VI secretion system protein ImpJ|nr:type VI secretion system baseplate subunit TssK [Holosporales bacterium]
MAESLHIPLAVQWHEGMLLSPHHFQQASAHFYALLHHSFRLARPDAYGLFSAEIDEAALAAGIVRLLHLEALFPDGLFVQYVGTRDPPVSYDAKSLLEVSGEKPLRLYAAVAVQRTGNDTIQDDQTRYLSLEGDEVCDDNTGDNPIRIPRLKPQLRLLLEEEVSARVTAFPLLEVLQGDQGSQVTSYIAPHLVVPEVLRKMAREMVKTLREKINYFSEKRYAFSAEGTAILRALAQGALPLEALLLEPKLSPFALYQAVLSAIAPVVALTPGQCLTELPPYGHENLYAVFTELGERLQRALESLKQSYYTIPFEKENNGKFRLHLSPTLLDRQEILIGFNKSSETKDNDFLDWIRGAQIAASSKMPTVRDNRVLGAARKIVSAEEELGVSAPQDVLLLSVDPHSPYLSAQEDLCILNAGCSQQCPKTAALYVRT